MPRPKKLKIKRPGKKRRDDCPMDVDTPLMQPMENWDKQDKRGASFGPTITFYPSKEYADNYELIDWSK